MRISLRVIGFIGVQEGKWRYRRKALAFVGKKGFGWAFFFSYI